jgi:hypothetical protein
MSAHTEREGGREWVLSAFGTQNVTGRKAGSEGGNARPCDAQSKAKSPNLRYVSLLWNPRLPLLYSMKLREIPMIDTAAETVSRVPWPPWSSCGAPAISVFVIWEWCKKCGARYRFVEEERKGKERKECLDYFMC